MGKYDIPVEDWFLFKTEALTYLNGVACEIRLKGTRDPMLSRIRLLTNFVDANVRSASRIDCTFQFEMDRGRMWKGHYYRVVVMNNVCSHIYRLGSAEDACLGMELPDLRGQDLMDAIREYLVLDVNVA